MSMFWVLAGQGAAYRASTQVDVAGASREARAARSGTEDLDARLERALMACEAMWSLVRDKLQLTDLQLIDRINELDLSDGKLDGKVRKTAVSCPSCGRTIARRHAKCMYCGQAVMHDPFS